MTEQCATLSRMGEPERVGVVASDWRERVRRIGIDPDALPEHRRQDDETPEEAHARKVLQAQNRSARWRDALPVMYAEARLTDLDGEQHAETITGWLGSGSSTLLLAGSVGSGKTHAAYAVGNAAVAAGMWVEAWTVADLLEALRPGGDGAAGAREADVLILDDVTASRVSEFAQESLLSILDARLRNRRRQVVTTNLPYGPMLEQWGARIMDRLAYRWTVCQFTGESRRRAAW